MPRGFERNIVWDSDPEKQPRYMPLSEAFPPNHHSRTAFGMSDYDLGFLASLRIKA